MNFFSGIPIKQCFQAMVATDTMDERERLCFSKAKVNFFRLHFYLWVESIWRFENQLNEPGPVI